MPIHVPMVDVHTIGAGGGSLGVINDAGYAPGGAKKRRRGAGPDLLWPGRHPSHDHRRQSAARPARSRWHAWRSSKASRLQSVRAIIGETIGGPLGLDPDAAAAAILRVANDRMAGAIRMVSLAPRPRPARLCPTGLWRCRSAARHGAGARARHPESGHSGATRHHQRDRLRHGRSPPRLRQHLEHATHRARHRPRERRSCRRRSRRGGRRSSVRRWRSRRSSCCTSPTCSSRARPTC